MKLLVGGGSKPSVPPGWAPRAASEISPGGLRARPPDQSPLGAASAVTDALPHSRPQRLRTKTRGPCVPQRGSVPGWGAVPSPAVTCPPVTHTCISTWCCRWARHPAGRPASASASQSIPPPPRECTAGQGGRVRGEGCRVTEWRGAGSRGEGSHGGGSVGSQGEGVQDEGV